MVLVIVQIQNGEMGVLKTSVSEEDALDFSKAYLKENEDKILYLCSPFKTIKVKKEFDIEEITIKEEEDKSVKH